MLSALVFEINDPYCMCESVTSKAGKPSLLLESHENMIYLRMQIILKTQLYVEDCTMFRGICDS